MNNKRKVMLVSMLLITTLILSACGGSKVDNTSQTETLKLVVAHTAPPEHPYQKGFEKMNEVIKAMSDGQMELEIHHSSALGEENQVLEALQLGTIDITTLSVAPMTGFAKDYLVCDFPFIFKDIEDAYKFYDGEFGELLFGKSDPLGFVGLAWWDNGFRNFTNSKRSIQSPEDMKGLKIRTMNSAVHMAAVKAMGASAIPIAYGELYSALQQKVVDGQENPVALIHDNRFYEVQEFLSLSQHFYDPSPVYISKKTMDKLSDEQKEIVREAAIEGRDHMRKLLNDEQAAQIETLKKNGMTVTELNDEQFAAFQNITQDVYKDFEADIDKETMKRFKELTGIQ